MTTAAFAQAAYKPKTSIIQPGEKIEPDEFYDLKVQSFMFRGRLRPGQLLAMRKGCLADIGDLVQLAGKPQTIDNVVIHQPGTEYTAVCVSATTPMELFNFRCEKIPKDYWHIEYTVNGVKKYSPWFNSPVTAFKAKQILEDKYGDDLGVYCDPCPGNKTTGWKPKKPYVRGNI